MTLSEQLDQLVADVEKAARVHLFYQPKDRTRDRHHREAAAYYQEMAEHLRALADEQGHLLRQAEKAEQVAEADEMAA